jgi:hypothetical protein
MTYGQLLQEQRDYYALCDEADRLGIPTSLDDPRSPRTVARLRAAVDEIKSLGGDDVCGYCGGHTISTDVCDSCGIDP